jgi:hypothetical protein
MKLASILFFLFDILYLFEIEWEHELICEEGDRYIRGLEEGKDISKLIEKDGESHLLNKSLLIPFNESVYINQSNSNHKLSFFNQYFSKKLDLSIIAPSVGTLNPLFLVTLNSYADFSHIADLSGSFDDKNKHKFFILFFF